MATRKKTYGGSTTDTSFSISDFIKTMAYMSNQNIASDRFEMSATNNYIASINSFVKDLTNLIEPLL